MPLLCTAVHPSGPACDSQQVGLESCNKSTRISTEVSPTHLSGKASFHPAYSVHGLKGLSLRLRQGIKIFHLILRKENIGPEIKRAGL